MITIALQALLSQPFSYAGIFGQTKCVRGGGALYAGLAATAAERTEGDIFLLRGSVAHSDTCFSLQLATCPLSAEARASIHRYPNV